MAHVDRDEAVLLGHVAGNEVQELPRKIDVIEGDPGGIQLLRQDLRELRLVQQARLDHEGAEPSPVGLLEGQHGRELLRRDDASIYQELSQPRP
jgi:hypothetical protein